MTNQDETEALQRAELAGIDSQIQELEAQRETLTKALRVLAAGRIALLGKIVGLAEGDRVTIQTQAMSYAGRQGTIERLFPRYGGLGVLVRLERKDGTPSKQTIDLAYTLVRKVQP